MNLTTVNHEIVDALMKVHNYSYTLCQHNYFFEKQQYVSPGRKLTKEDFEKFLEGLNESIEHIRQHAPESPSRPSTPPASSDVQFEDLG